jgi:hypothetical protein
MENFDHNIVYEHETVFMTGQLEQIRKRFNQIATRQLPSWRFSEKRQHWTLRNASDQGFPLRGAWRIKCGTEKPRLESGIRCWRAESAPSLDLEIAHTGKATTARVFWQRLDNDKWDTKKSLTFDINPDGKFHSYRVNLAASAEYRGLITGLAIEPMDQVEAGTEIAIRAIALASDK